MIIDIDQNEKSKNKRECNKYRAVVVSVEYEYIKFNLHKEYLPTGKLTLKLNVENNNKNRFRIDRRHNCGTINSNKFPFCSFLPVQSPKFAPPIEFVDQATLSPPEGYKDGSLLDSALSDALSNHVFGAQHIQQLQVIQRLQQQRAAMLAARAAASSQQQQQQQPQTTQQQPIQQPIQQQQQQQIPQQQQLIQQQNVIIDPQQQTEICPECTQCSECAAAKLAELEAGGEFIN